MLKIDMHTHCNEDPRDGFIRHSAKELIDHASRLNFNVLSITCHNKVVYSKDLQEYANQKNILLIPGTEIDIDNRHVLVYNITEEEREGIKSFDDLRKIKRKDMLVIAPHPFYIYINPLEPKQISLFSRLENNIDVFDGIEFCHLYTRKLNGSNHKAVQIANKYHLPLIAGSDLHHLNHMGTNFSLIDAEKDMSSIFGAIKNNKVTVSSRPRDTTEITKLLTFFTTQSLKHKILNIARN